MKTKNFSGTETQEQTREWLHETNFLKAEIRFLRTLIERHLLFTASKNKEVTALELINRELALLEMQNNGLKQALFDHNEHLQKMHCDSYISGERESIVIEHAKLEMLIQGFLKALRQCKYNLFIAGGPLLNTRKLACE